MKVIFDKEAFLKDSQANLFAPRYYKLVAGDIGEWVIALLFWPTLGVFWYLPLVLCHVEIKF